MKLEEFMMHQTDVLVLSAGDTLFSEGDAGDSMYVLLSGQADVMLRGKLVETLTSGSIVGELALIDDAPRSASVVAREDCNLIAINAARFRTLTRENPDFALHVMRAMADRLRNVGKLL